MRCFTDEFCMFSSNSVVFAMLWLPMLQFRCGCDGEQTLSSSENTSSTNGLRRFNGALGTDITHEFQCNT